MAKAKAVRTKRKERKNIEFGVAHIQSTFNNTLKVLKKALLLLLNKQQRKLPKLQWNMV